MNWSWLQKHSLKTRATLFTLSIFLISIWSLAFYADQTLRKDMQRLLGEQQFSTVTLLANEINQELSSRIHMMEKVAQDIRPQTLASPEDLQDQLAKLVVFQELFNGGIFVTALDGIARASLPVSANRLGVNYSDRDYIAAALREGRASISRPLVGRTLQIPVIAMAVPIRDVQGQVIGALAAGINLGKSNFLDRVEKDHLGKTGNYLVVAPQYRLIVSSSDKSRILETLPPPDANPMLERFIRGYEGTEVLINPLGEQVLASVKRIPVAGWYAAIALPTSVAFAPIRAMQERLLLATLLLTVLAGGLTWWMLRRELEPLQVAVRTLSALSETNRPLHSFPVTRQDEIGQLISAFNRLVLALKQRQEGLEESEERYRTAFRTSPDALTITRLSDGQYLDVNDGFSHLFGWTREEVIGKTSRDIGIWPNWDERVVLMRAIEADGHCENLEAELVTKDRKLITTLVSANVISLAGEPCLLSVTHDITARKETLRQIEHLAYADALTELPNRRLFTDRLKHAIAANVRHRQYGALVYVDLDNFKTLNDTLGHDMGDLLLQKVARRLSVCVRDEDMVARIGGDEFVVLLEQLSPDPEAAATGAEKVAEKILAAFDLPFSLNKIEHHTSCSIGITLFGDQQENTVDPLKRADLAMYQAKAAGRNALRFFDPQMQAMVNMRAALEVSMREALQKQQFLLHYQVQVNDAGEITGVEALVRWQDPQRGLVSPAEFIPLAEETGLILPLGNWALHTACAQLARWRDQPGMARLTMAVNVSARQFHQDDFVAQVLEALASTGAKANQLKLELTESMLAVNIDDVIAKMTALRAQGVNFSLDDFGTGFSSLAYLKRLPLDQLKIDQGFVRDILVDPNDAAIAKMVVALGNSLGLKVIAEGVETEAQREALAGLGCRSYQGYLFSRPLPILELETLMRVMDNP